MRSQMHGNTGVLIKQGDILQLKKINFKETEKSVVVWQLR